MVGSLTYRTDDFARWGAGQGSDLDAHPIDVNFWILFVAIGALEAAQANFGAGISYITQPVGTNQLFVTLTDHRVLGPFTIPIAGWNPRGPWEPLTTYGAFDVVDDHNGALYITLIPHTSAATFSPYATDGLGHNLYILLLRQPQNEIPTNGVLGQRLAKASGSPYATAWVTDYLRLAAYIEGQPTANEMFMQYVCVDHMKLPVGLAGSIAYNSIASNTTVVYTIKKNGSSIGSISFAGTSPHTITATFASDVFFVPGDVITMFAPAVPDSLQANISFTLKASLTDLD